MQALARLQNEEVVLLAATTALNPEIDLAVEHRTLASRVKLVAKRDLPASELATLFSAADVFCLPTYGEGMSNSLLEAMAAGLPVVTTPVGGHAEVIDDGVEGLLVEAREIASLTNALGRLEGSADLRRRMGMAARRRAEVIGTPFNAGERLSRMFDQVLRMGPPIQQHLENPYASALEVVA
jgi:glycosyltransferase involved in cell wall biosynthesis